MFVMASEEILEDGQLIFEEGSSGDWVYLILAGSVEISKTIKDKKFIIEWLQEGEVFGGASFMGSRERLTTASAVGKTTVGLIERAPLDEEFNKLSPGFRAILSASIKRSRKVIERACAFSYRRTPRYQKTLSLTYRNRERFVKAYTANVSEGGLLIRTENPLKKSERFLLNLQLPDLPNPLKIKCEVAWAIKQEEDPDNRPSGMGVKFSEMSGKDNQILKQYLEKLAKNTD